LKKLKIILIDDEKRTRSAIAGSISLHYPNAEIIGEAESVESAVAILNNTTPDIVLLDIKMPDGTGFDLLSRLMPVKFKIIFVTAYDEFAVRAFKFNAVEYLMKPIVPSELVQALDKAKSLLNIERENLKLTQLISTMAGDGKTITLNTQDAKHVLNTKQIIRCEAERNYTRFHLLDGRSIFVSRGLKEYEEQLKDFGFFRIHNSHLINISLIETLLKRNSPVVKMVDGSEIPVAIRKYSKLQSILSKITGNDR